MLFAFFKQLLSFSGELRHFMEKCDHDSKRLNDIKTIKLYMESGCGNVTAEEAAGDRLCFPALVKIQLLLPFVYMLDSC